MPSLFIIWQEPHRYPQETEFYGPGNNAYTFREMNADCDIDEGFMDDGSVFDTSYCLDRPSLARDARTQLDGPFPFDQ